MYTHTNTQCIYIYIYHKYDFNTYIKIHPYHRKIPLRCN